MAIINEDARVGKETLEISKETSAESQPGSPRKDDDASSTDAGSATWSPSSPGARWCDMASEASEDSFELREQEFETKDCVACQVPRPLARPKTFQDDVEDMMQHLCATLQLFWCCAGASCAWSGRTCTVQAVIPMEHVPHVQQLVSLAKNALVAMTSSRVTMLGSKAPFVQTSTGFNAFFSEMMNRKTACWDSFMYGQCKRGRQCTWEHPENNVTLNFVVMAMAWRPQRVLQAQPSDAQDERAK